MIHRAVQVTVNIEVFRMRFINKMVVSSIH